MDQQPPYQRHLHRLLSNRRDLLKSGKYSDLTITCQGREWLVHRSVVCAQSRFFAAACDGEFEEARSGKVDLAEEYPDIVELVVGYLYNMDYSDEDAIMAIEDGAQKLLSETVLGSKSMLRSEGNITGITASMVGTDEQILERTRAVKEADDMATIPSIESRISPPTSQQNHSSLLLNIHVYATADKLDIPDLRDLAAEKFKARFQKWPEYDCAAIVSKVLKCTSINDRGLRPVVATMCVRYVEEITGGYGTDEDKVAEKKAQWAGVFAHESDFLFSILQQSTIQKGIESIESHQLKIQYNQLASESIQRKQQYNKTDQALQTERREHRDYTYRVEKMLSLANSQDKCVSCRASFRPWFRFEGVILPFPTLGTLNTLPTIKVPDKYIKPLPDLLVNAAIILKHLTRYTITRLGTKSENGTISIVRFIHFVPHTGKRMIIVPAAMALERKPRTG
ncbi:hypothetical protein G7Y79_00029g063670 [Physcia stellaris]|nr:hypothetical protein G7Y79_00029g063670 [Physcia stellaris]